MVPERIAAMAPVTTLVLPGLSDAGPHHWQSHWERADPSIRRVVQDDWTTPRCADWVARLARVLGEERDDVVLVAHSAACALVAHWARSAPAAAIAMVRGALLVAPADPDGPAFSAGPTGFAPMPMKALPFRSIVVASTDDRTVSLPRARAFARAWRSDFVNVGARGHLDSASGLGAWNDGRRLLVRLQVTPSRRGWSWSSHASSSPADASPEAR